MIIHEAPQGSEEWLRARAGKITASNFKTARATLKKTGEPTEATLNYAFRVAVETISGLPMDEGFQTWAMRRGNELEPEAKSLFELKTGLTVDLAGFVTTDCGRYGASADGLINNEAGLEIKCLVSPEGIRNALLSGDITDWYDQVQGGMWITGLNKWHFVIYCPALAGINRDLTHWIIERDDTYIEALQADLLRFTGLVDSYIHQLTQQAA